MMNKARNKLSIICATTCTCVGLLSGAYAQGSKTSNQPKWQETLAPGDHGATAKTYSDYMVEHGRNVHGEAHSASTGTRAN